MMRTSVLVVSLVLRLVTCDPNMLDECIVKEIGNVVHLSTFNDTVEFRIERFREIEVDVVVSQGSTEASFRLKDLELNMWQEVQMTLAEEPTLTYGNKTVKDGGEKRIMKGTRKNIEVRNAHVLWRCKEGWPSRELDKSDNENKVMALSGRDEESLILKPLTDTKITFSVDRKEMVLCTGQDSSQLMVFDSGQESECAGDLKTNTRYPIHLKFDDGKKMAQVLDGNHNELSSFQYTKKSLKFLRTDLEGTFYIVQCLHPCLSSGSSGLAHLSVLPLTIVTAALVTIMHPISASLPFVAGL